MKTMTTYSRAVAALAHSMIYILALDVAVGLTAAFHVLTGLVPMTTTLIVLCASAMMYHSHSSTPCVRCITEVPADAPVRAQRRKRVLWLFHFLGTRAGVASVVAILLAQLLLPAVVRSSDSTNLCQFSITLVTAILLYVKDVHRRLRPWCPYCRRWDDDGDHECVPDPSTFGTKTAY
jgi:hypothetical protein